MTDRLDAGPATRATGRFQTAATETAGWFVDGEGRMARRSTDLAGPTPRIDDAAVFSALQFGAIVPPRSPWVGVRRLLPGFRYAGSICDGPVAMPAAGPTQASHPEEQSTTICALLDRILETIVGDGPDPVVLFSGGVDSGLIASRLAALGRKDTLLLNLDFGEDDREAQLAREMASQLGLPFESIRSPHGLCDVLEAPGQVYPEPFADPSTVPTADLAHAVSAHLAGGKRRPILEGTGADGAFGVASKIPSWRRVLQIPAPVRSLVSLTYATLLWHRESRLEYRCRIVRRSATMPLLSAVIAYNPLAGILYKADHAQTIHSSLEEWIGGWAGQSITRRVVGADLALVCANIYAQKSWPIYEKAGFEIHYPFLDPALVTFAMSSIEAWSKEEPKAVLKRALARHVPAAMVYRPKSGFAPDNQMFHHEKFIAQLRAASEPDGPISSSLCRRRVVKACDFLARGKALPLQTYFCLWAITFIDRWYRTAT